MARDLDMPHIRRMIKRAYIIMLHQACRVEVMDEGLQVLVFAISGWFRGVGYWIVDNWI
jgi:hypothetical protein